MRRPHLADARVVALGEAFFSKSTVNSEKDEAAFQFGSREGEMNWRPLFLASFTASLALVPNVAHACGAASPGGPSMCSLDEHEAEKNARSTRLSLTYGFKTTTLLFGDGRRADMQRHTIFGSVDRLLSKRVTWVIGGGVIAEGSLRHEGKVDALGPGLAISSGLAYRIVDETKSRPFVVLSAMLSFTHAETRVDEAIHDQPSFTAFDLRLGGVVGKAFGPVRPYALARAFGGPIFWKYNGASVTGTDLYKYEVGAGVAVSAGDLDLFVEGVPLGERGVSSGLGVRFR